MNFSARNPSTLKSVFVNEKMSDEFGWFLDSRRTPGRCAFVFMPVSTCALCSSSSVPHSAGRAPHPGLTPVAANQAKQVTNLGVFSSERWPLLSMVLIKSRTADGDVL